MDLRSEAEQRVLLRRFLTQGGVGVAVAVTAAAVSKVVVFADGEGEPDANFAVLVSTSWDTRVWVTDKLATGFTLNFSTAAPAGATIDYVILRK